MTVLVCVYSGYHASAKNISTEDTWSETWNDSTMMSPPPKVNWHIAIYLL